MELDGVHIFIILMLALMCSSCLGSFMREGYENSDKGDQGTDPKSDKFVRKPVGETYQDGYSDYYRDLDQETVEYSDSKLAKNKRMKPHRSKEDYNDDDNEDNNEDNNINSYGNVNKYPNVENDNILTAGRGGNGKHSNSNNSGSNGGSNNGVSGSRIPPGDEDLYILKSQVIPPVCPACPAVVACPSDNKKCPPCPPCARCPEPAFECKKVPNYSGQNDSYLPQPVMSDFSQFGL